MSLTENPVAEPSVREDKKTEWAGVFNPTRTIRPDGTFDPFLDEELDPDYWTTEEN